MRIGSIIIFHLNKLRNAKFFILYDVILLVRLQGKCDIDHFLSNKLWTWVELRYLAQFSPTPSPQVAGAESAIGTDQFYSQQYPPLIAAPWLWEYFGRMSQVEVVSWRDQLNLVPRLFRLLEAGTGRWDSLGTSILAWLISIIILQGVWISPFSNLSLPSKCDVEGHFLSWNGFPYPSHQCWTFFLQIWNIFIAPSLTIWMWMSRHRCRRRRWTGNVLLFQFYPTNHSILTSPNPRTLQLSRLSYNHWAGNLKLLFRQNSSPKELQRSLIATPYNSNCQF